MRRVIALVSFLALLTAAWVGGPAQAQTQPVPGLCVEGVLPSGALSLFCVPAAGWNGDLVVWAHGYVGYNEPLGFYYPSFVPDTLQGLGYAFATTSFRVNGLAILQGADDVRELVAAFPATAGHAPLRTYMTGASEGGIITTLLIERSPELFSGGLAACGPIGSFRKQIAHVGDFRVLFDYFFPAVLPPSPITIPQEVIDDWETVYVPRVEAALAADPAAARQLIRTSGAAIDPQDPTSVAATTLSLLWYNVFGANDAGEKLGGNPYDNRHRLYLGSLNDLKLNLSVERFKADAAALREVENYETSGSLKIPLVTLHTTGDPLVPFWHERLYAEKLDPVSRQQVTPLPVRRYGHCAFTKDEVLVGFALLIFRVTGSLPTFPGPRRD